MVTCTDKQAGHRGIRVFCKMEKHNGQEQHRVAWDNDLPSVTMKECREFNAAADRLLAKYGEETGNWRSKSKRGLSHRSAMAAVDKRKRRPSCGD
jgi:hypothetical protein